MILTPWLLYLGHFGEYPVSGLKWGRTECVCVCVRLECLCVSPYSFPWSQQTSASQWLDQPVVQQWSTLQTSQPRLENFQIDVRISQNIKTPFTPTDGRNNVLICFKGPHFISSQVHLITTADRPPGADDFEREPWNPYHNWNSVMVTVWRASPAESSQREPPECVLIVDGGGLNPCIVHHLYCSVSLINLQY